MNIKLFLPCITILSAISCFISLKSEPTVYLHSQSKQHLEAIAPSLNKFNIKFEIKDSIDSDDDKNLYIICDVFNIDKHDLPKHYIAYQSLDLNSHQLTQSYAEKLANAVAVWDPSKNNINRYRSVIHNYLYFPSNYKHADPAILPCCMPLDTLDTYKELLIYSNKKDTDISSHLPALFCHTVLQNPKIIVEAGARGGESTKPLQKALNFSNGVLIGLDIEETSARSYASVNNGIFLLMNDLDFDKYYEQSPFAGKKIDVVFIDTSHIYEQTLKEITLFAPMLSENGFLSFHDSNVTPLEHAGYVRLNGSSDRAPGNPRGVTQAIKEYFSLEFDEYKYFNATFTRDGVNWNITHYPFCNGLTIIKKVKNA